jgi:putative membrane protein
MKLAHVAASLLLAALPLSAISQQKMAQEDQKRFQGLAEANLAEVETGKLAQEKARADEVKKFGEHMVEDHGKMLEEMKQMAEKKGAKVPDKPNKEHQAAMKKLEKASGESFDAAYMQQMVKDHQKALKLAQDTAKNAKDPELKAAAQKAAPDIQKHLKMAQDLSRQTQAKGKSGGKSAAGGSAEKKSK